MNLYVADRGSHRIRKVVLATGQVTTIAGSVEGWLDGSPHDTRFNTPSGIALAPDGSLVVADTRYWLEDLVVVKKGAPDPNAKARRDVRQAQPGDVLPDGALVDQDGRRFQLSGLRGRAYALTFVFTRCPLPDFCPLMMRHFASVEERLVADVALRERTRLVTVSFDTKHDTPDVLRAAAK